MRSISTGSQTALASNDAPTLIFLVEMMTTPPVRLNSTNSPLTYNGFTYDGAGLLGSIEAVTDSPGDTQGIKLGLSGVTSTAVAYALADEIRGARTTLSLAVLHPTTRAVADNVQLFSGTLDQMPIAYGPESSDIGVTVIHRGETFSRPKPLRNTDADQQKLYPGDTSRRFVVSQSQKQDVWPAASFYRR